MLLHEFRVQLDEYLDAVHGGPRSLEELIEYDIAHAAEVMPFFAQDLLLEAHATEGLDAPRYRDALAAIERFRSSLGTLFADRRLDALVAPANSRAWRIDWVAGDRFAVGSSTIAAVSGYPSVAVPASLANELPLGLALIGKPRGDARLLELAAAFEAARGPAAGAAVPTVRRGLTLEGLALACGALPERIALLPLVVGEAHREPVAEAVRVDLAVHLRPEHHLLNHRLLVAQAAALGRVDDPLRRRASTTDASLDPGSSEIRRTSPALPSGRSARM